MRKDNIYTMEVGVKSLGGPATEQLSAIFNILTPAGFNLMRACTASADYGPYAEYVSGSPLAITPAQMVVYDGRATRQCGIQLFSRGRDTLERAGDTLSAFADDIEFVGEIELARLRARPQPRRKLTL